MTDQNTQDASTGATEISRRGVRDQSWPEAIDIFDTTLRDGSQFEGIALTADDKLKIAHLLDDLGVHYIEGAGRVPTRATTSSSGGRPTAN